MPPMKIHITGGRTVHSLPWRTTSGQAAMVGTGAALLGNPGGAGMGSTYDSVDQYKAVTGRPVLGSGLAAMLSNLKVQPISRKPKNIKFEV